MSELDLQKQTLEPGWTQNKAAFIPWLNEEGEQMFAQDGTPLFVPAGEWRELAMFTSDLRFGNLTGEEVDFCRHFTDLAFDLKQAGYASCPVMAHERAINVYESSQSRDGFLRKLMNTLIKKEEHTMREAPKKSIFGGGKGGDGQ